MKTISFIIKIQKETKIISFSERRNKMLIDETVAVKVRKKRAVENIGKVNLAKKLNITPTTLSKVELGNYDAPRRIYQSVMNWLVEDL